MSIIDFNLTYLPEMKYLCAKNCAYQILEYLGYQNPLQYLYVGFVPYIGAYKDNFIANGKPTKICGEYSYIVEGKGNNFDEIFQKNISQLSDGIIPILIVDTFYLPYRNECKRYHGSHAIIFCGFNNGMVEIIDWYDSIFFKGKISINDFRLARTSLCNDLSNPFASAPISNAWYYIDSSKINNEMRLNILNENLRILAYGIEPKNKFEKTGMDCLKYLSKTITSKLDCYNNEKSDLMKKLHNALFPFFCISKLMILYIDNVLANYNTRSIVEIIKRMTSLLEKINYNSMKCTLLYNEICYIKVVNYLQELIIYYEKMQIEAKKIYGDIII